MMLDTLLLNQSEKQTEQIPNKSDETEIQAIILASWTFPPPGVFPPTLDSIIKHLSDSQDQGPIGLRAKFYGGLSSSKKNLADLVKKLVKNKNDSMTAKVILHPIDILGVRRDG
jgi:hypothetical protein